MQYLFGMTSLLAAGLLAPNVSPAASLGVHFSWTETSACSGTPPAFTIANVPTGTKYLEFKLVDLDKLDFVHGGGEIPYSGSGKIPAGAFGGSYRGPCPPDGATHTYEWTVDALDDSKSKVLAEGKARGRFPPQ
jgi:Phosphatidylethanolamine-binding protein